MTQEALKLALEALENGDVPTSENAGKNLDAITAIKESLAQTQEPKIGCVNHDCDKCKAQRTWVGLTNNELQPIADEYRILFGGWVEDFARAIEAKFKEKNT